MFEAHLKTRAGEVLSKCRHKGKLVATVESCTGGLVSALLTDIPGSSDVFDRGFVTYSNVAKTDLVGVPADLIKAHGAVSREVVIGMAEGGLARSNADIVVAITGVAGPGGGTAKSPVGLVYFALACKGHETVHQRCLFGDLGRAAVRQSAMHQALDMIEAALSDQ
jgi:nicotinamide-nucleotide amidase